MIVIFFQSRLLYICTTYLLLSMLTYIYIQYYTLGCVIVKAVLAKQAPSMNANYIM